MKHAATFAVKGAWEVLEARHSRVLQEILSAIPAASAGVPPTRHKLTQAISRALTSYGNWATLALPEPALVGNATSDATPGGHDPTRETVMVKDGVGVGLPCASPAPMICSVCAKMTIFHNLGHIDCGVEIVPVKALAQEMSSGVSYFEQFVWDLDHRGVADIDIPVLILGVDA